MSARTVRLAVRSLVGAGLLALTGTVASAQTPPPKAPDPKAGRDIAEKLCTSCHRISPEQPPTTWVDVPSFPEIANRPGRTFERIIGSVMLPHPPMPDIALSNPTLRDIAAYILTFKKDN